MPKIPRVEYVKVECRAGQEMGVMTLKGAEGGTSMVNCVPETKAPIRRVGYRRGKDGKLEIVCPVECDCEVK